MQLILCDSAGAGKTKVTSRVIDELLDVFGRRPNGEMLAYFYFNRNDAQRHNAEAALYSLVRQLSKAPHANELQQPLLDLYAQHEKRGLAAQRPPRGDCERLLFDFVDAYPQTTLVLDALDECSADDRMELVALLDKLVRVAVRPVKVFVSSRLDRDIRERFASGPNFGIHATDNRDDIALFLAAEIERRPQWANRVPKRVQEESIRKMCEKSQGM
jgi:hypothetical protein